MTNIDNRQNLKQGDKHGVAEDDKDWSTYLPNHDQNLKQGDKHRIVKNDKHWPQHMDPITIKT